MQETGRNSVGCNKLFILTAIFPGEPGLAVTKMSPFWILFQLRMMEVVVTTGAVRRAKLWSNRHHQQTNSFLQAGCPSCCRTNSVKALKKKLAVTNCILKISTSVSNNLNLNSGNWFINLKLCMLM